MAVVVLLALALSTGAQQPPNTYTGCLNQKQGTVTQIAIGDAPVGGACLRNTVKIQWNQLGPQGPQGPQGEQGVQGEQGIQGPPGVAEGITKVVHGMVRPLIDNNGNWNWSPWGNGFNVVGDPWGQGDPWGPTARVYFDDIWGSMPTCTVTPLQPWLFLNDNDPDLSANVGMCAWDFPVGYGGGPLTPPTNYIQVRCHGYRVSDESDQDADLFAVAGPIVVVGKAHVHGNPILRKRASGFSFTCMM